MKTSVLASLLFGACAVAAPVDKRALVIKTEVVTETIVIYTTVYDDEPVPAATTTPQGLFFEVPASSSVPAQQTSAPAPVDTPAQQPASPAAPTPAPQTTPAAASTPTPASQATQQQQQQAPAVSSEPVQQAAPVATTSVAAAPAAATSAAPAAQQQAPSTSSTTTGQTYSGDITIYDNNGNKGACGTSLYDTDMIVALNQATWGQSTYNVMTGEATNPWCGQKIRVTYKGNSIDATIMDLCPGCSGSGDIDLSLAAWKALTGLDEKTRLQASWQKIA